ncbi:TonB-dependent receptor [Caulobacter flavus]|uniref:TonB-dependent receptor n=1 Tax=Caulobacter flavus TaxID=1679497 RepID=A0A2N5D372_9CAUL|nr:TonB-dependent receptor [Caulobacter flavus]AYV48956.1 TonB-dependent receptor [Caulobacter flavus]PLR20524.1 TonB-dependent receptor [Caulobacter flavus]
MKSRLMMASAVGVWAVLAGSAWAEAPAATAPDAPTQVDQVVVTGEKASRSVQDTVTSVAVTTARTIEREQIRDFYDVIAKTANMSETYGKSGFTIRGVANNNVSGGGTGGLATVYVDGAAIPERAMYGGPLDMWDVGQVEIFRGPQSTLQGRNALAGAVIVRTTDPTSDWNFKVRASTASGDDRSIAFAGGGPIVADQLAFRVAFEDHTADGFIYNTTRKADDDTLDSRMIRGKLLLTPASAEGFKAIATYSRNERKSGYLYTYSRTDTPDYYDHRVTTTNSPNTSDITTDIATLEVEQKLSQRFILSGVASWSQVDLVQRYDGDLGPQTLSYGGQDEMIETSSQEVRLNYEGERLKGLVGLYHATRDAERKSASLTNVEFPRATLVSVLTGQLVSGGYPLALAQATANQFATAYIAQLPVIPVDYSSDAPELVETTAIFADGTFALTPRLSVLGGFRYDREKNTQSSVQTALFAGTYPNPANFPTAYAPFVVLVNQFVGSMVAQAGAPSPKTTREFEAFLPKIGAKYAWTDDISTSFVVQRGYRSGGTAINTARSTVVAYDPEYTWNYELSLRTYWPQWGLTANANAYYVDWTDQQVSLNLGLNAYDYQVENAGSSHLYGFEVELAQRLSAKASWYASLGHTRTEFDEFNVDTGADTRNLSGSEFPYAPHWTFSIGGDYRFGNGLVANLNANYRDRSYTEAGGEQDGRIAGERTLVNGRFGYESDRWGAYVFGKNLLNEKYSQYSREDVPVALLGEPRVLGVSLEARW